MLRIKVLEIGDNEFTGVISLQDLKNVITFDPLYVIGKDNTENLKNSINDKNIENEKVYNEINFLNPIYISFNAEKIYKDEYVVNVSNVGYNNENESYFDEDAYFSNNNDKSLVMSKLNNHLYINHENNGKILVLNEHKQIIDLLNNNDNREIFFIAVSNYNLYELSKLFSYINKNENLENLFFDDKSKIKLNFSNEVTKVFLEEMKFNKYDKIDFNYDFLNELFKKTLINKGNLNNASLNINFLNKNNCENLGIFFREIFDNVQKEKIKNKSWCNNKTFVERMLNKAENFDIKKIIIEAEKKNLNGEVFAEKVIKIINKIEKKEKSNEINI